MKQQIRRLVTFGAVVVCAISQMAGTAMAHVVVKPSEVATAAFQTFTIGVPNEKDVPTTALKLIIPAGLKEVSPTQKPGWQIDVVRSGSGEAASVSAITWSGGNIDPELRDDFSFSAQVPAQPANLQWKAYQTYADGTVVSWDQPASHDEESATSGPASVTKIVSNTEADSALQLARQSADKAVSAANRAVYISLVAALIGLVAFASASRRR